MSDLLSGGSERPIDWGEYLTLFGESSSAREGTFWQDMSAIASLRNLLPVTPVEEGVVAADYHDLSAGIAAAERVVGAIAIILGSSREYGELYTSADLINRLEEDLGRVGFDAREEYDERLITALRALNGLARAIRAEDLPSQSPRVAEALGVAEGVIASEVEHYGDPPMEFE